MSDHQHAYDYDNGELKPVVDVDKAYKDFWDSVGCEPPSPGNINDDIVASKPDFEMPSVDSLPDGFWKYLAEQEQKGAASQSASESRPDDTDYLFYEGVMTPDAISELDRQLAEDLERRHEYERMLDDADIAHAADELMTQNDID